VLQTDKASRKWPATDAFEAELRAAFAECVPSPAARERQKKREKGGDELIDAAGGKATSDDRQQKRRKGDGEAPRKKAKAAKTAKADGPEGLEKEDENYGYVEEKFTALIPAGTTVDSSTPDDGARPKRKEGKKAEGTEMTWAQMTERKTAKAKARAKAKKKQGGKILAVGKKGKHVPKK